jgi:hypothetical protein
VISKFLRRHREEQEEERDEDFALLPVTFDLISVDNERAFFPPIGVDSGSGTPQQQLMMKDFILCLPCMEDTVNIFAAAEFCALDMYKVLDAWIYETQYKIFPRIRKIFSDKDIRLMSPVRFLHVCFFTDCLLISFSEFTIFSLLAICSTIQISNKFRNPKELWKKPLNLFLVVPFRPPAYLDSPW